MSKLLIVDDSIDLLSMMEYIIERQGHTVKTLCRCDNIYNEIDSYKPDLLILDIILDGNDGREICRELRKNAATLHLGILVFSASPKALMDYKTFSADDFLEKPFEIKILLQKIKSMLEWTEIRKKAFLTNQR